MSKPDGGPAYPLPIAVGPTGDLYETGALGMTLRDWFAGQACSRMLEYACEGRSYEEIAEQVWQFADAMIAERDKP